MLQHYLKASIRNFLRHKVSFFINLIGLTTGLVCTLFIYLWVDDELSIDKFHDKDDRLFKVMEHQTYSDFVSTTSSTPGILAENIKIDFPEIKYAATTTWIGKSQLSYDEEHFKEDGFHVGEDFFNIFSYPLLYGNPDEVLKGKASMCISEDLAIKFFGNAEAAIGKPLRFMQDRSLEVTGVFKNIPSNSTYVFDFVVNYEDFKERNEWVKEWGNNGPRTFVILEKGTSPSQLTAKITNYLHDKDENSNVDLFLKKYSDHYLNGSYTNGQPDGGRIEYIRLFSAIALFILIIACINFMNLSTARASKRAHEVGVRKAIGAGQRSLILQYIGESLIISFLSLVMAIIIVAVGIQGFNQITDKEIVLVLNSTLVVGFLSITIFTGLLAGSYPALYLTSFSPVAVLKGDIKTSKGELWARKGLVVFQFTLTIILIVGVVVIYNQIQYVFNKNLGYDQENLIFFNQEGKVDENRETFLSEIRRLPGVLSAGGIGHNLLGRNSNTSGLEWKGKNPEERILFENISVSHETFETMKFKMAMGRTFDKSFGADTTKMIINQAALKVMGLEDPIGENIKLWDEYDLEIIGVVEDFHFQSFKEEVAPAFFRISENTWNIAIRLKSGSYGETIKAVEEVYTQFNPGFLFEPRFLDEGYAELYNAELRVSTLSRYFAGFAILISCLGLFGLAAFTAERRLKEIGIRKVLGASVRNIVIMLSMDFSKLVMVAVIIALPTAYFLLVNWLDQFAYRITIHWGVFGMAAALSILIAWLTVSTQAFKAASINPAKCLKDE